MFASEASAGNRVLIAVNSKGNIRDTNFNMVVSIPEVRDFLENAASRHSLHIKGVTYEDGSEPNRGAISREDVATLEEEFAQVKNEMEDVQKNHQ